MSRIDGREFARCQGRLSGRLLVHNAPRLEELGWRVDAVDFTLRGRSGGHGKLYLDLEGAGTLTTTCQRCLLPLHHRVALARELMLADSMEQIEEADDDIDRVLASSSMDVQALVEDEIILELPMVGKHEGCEAPPLEEHRNGPLGSNQSGLRDALRQWARKGRAG